MQGGMASAAGIFLKGIILANNLSISHYRDTLRSVGLRFRRCISRDGAMKRPYITEDGVRGGEARNAG